MCRTSRWAGRWWCFSPQHLGHPIPSPAVFTKIGKAFRAAVARFAAKHQIPVVRLTKDARKQEVMRSYLEQAELPRFRGHLAVPLVSWSRVVGFSCHGGRVLELYWVSMPRLLWRRCRLWKISRYSKIALASSTRVR
jgi:hypothetical protein